MAAVSDISAKLWLYVPNWRDGYQVTRTFKTDMTVSRSGKEQRRALRTTPRKTINFTVTVAGMTMTSLHRFLTLWQHRQVYMPDFVNFLPSTGVLAANAYTVTVDEPADWMTVDSQVVLNYGEAFELRKIAGISGVNVTFADTSETTWPIGTKIYRTMNGNLAPDLQGSRPTNGVAEVKISFDVEPTSEPLDAGETGLTFNGREVLLKKPNWADAPSVTFSHPSEVVDYGYGRISRATPVNFATLLKQMSFVGRDAVETRSIEQFFTRMKGQRGEFYMPTWDYDLKPKVVAPSGTNSIRVAGLDVAQAFEADTVYRAIAIFHRDGTHQLHKVQEIYAVDDEAGNDSIVQCATVFSKAVDPAEVVMVCWLPVWRFASDALTTEWLTDQVAQFKISVRTLEDLEGQ